jgi:hypothetical protein
VSNFQPRGLEERRHWARRQGTPGWLWPEIAPEDWRLACARLAEVLQAIVQGNEAPSLAGRPDAMSLAAYTSGLGPMLGWWIERGLLAAAEPIAENLTLQLEHNRLRMHLLRRQADDMVARLLDRGVRAVLLKGASTAGHYFPEPGTRPMSDIDLLVAAEDEVPAAGLLRSAGFDMEKRSSTESCWRMAGTATEPRNFFFVHAEDPWSIDLHTSLNLSVGAGIRPVDLDAAEPLKSARHDGVAAGRIVQPLLLLHLAIHAGAGLHNMTLLRLLELVLVIRRDTATGDLCWSGFLDLARRTRSLGYAYPALAICRQLAPDTVPDSVIAVCRDAAPPGVVRAVAGLTPATAHRVDRTSVREHFMWTRGLAERSRQLAGDLAPHNSLREIVTLNCTRIWTLLRGRVSR